MVFSSVLFLFLFLPAVLGAVLLTPRRVHNPILLAFSLLFYAWGEGALVVLLLGSIAMNYLVGLGVDRLPGARQRRTALVFGVALNLLLLGGYKYTNFLVDTLNGLLPYLQLSRIQLSRIHLPIGISFFTFQAISYLVDVYRGQCRASTNPVNTALYIALFPQLVAGPIVRYADLHTELVERRVTLTDFSAGIQRFVYGLGKKVLLANVLAVPADAAFQGDPSQLGTATAWLGIVCYTLQIYFDFSGYSDMAIGMGRMFGFHFRENFDYPYVARSVKEFWRRWHISLSTWFRDYLYIPLGGSRGGTVRTYLNLVTVFFLCGLWHGASWTFVLWGLFHGLFLVIERLGLGRLLSRLPRLVAHLYLLFLVTVAWVFFRAESGAQALAYLTRLFSWSPEGSGRLPFSYYFHDALKLALVVALLLSIPIYPFLRVRLRHYLQRDEDLPFAWRHTLASVGVVVWTMLILGLSSMALAAGTHNPFIYYRF